MCILRIITKESTMIVLGIESSCDETGLALYSEKKGLIKHLVNSQIDLFTEYGGVIPEIAARDHSVKIVRILEELIEDTGIGLNDIDLIGLYSRPWFNWFLGGWRNGCKNNFNSSRYRALAHESS